MTWPSNARELGQAMDASQNHLNEAAELLYTHFGDAFTRSEPLACGLLALVAGIMKRGGCTRTQLLDIAATLYDRIEVVELSEKLS